MATQYVMRATLSGTTLVRWVVTGTPDYTGEKSDYNPSDLSDIAVDYVSILPTINVGANSFLYVPSGDISGTATVQTVVGIYNNPVAPTTPVNSAVPIWDNSVYDIRQLTEDDILPGFNIIYFSGGGIYECGDTAANPSFSADYTGIPTSASITNTDNINSPLILISPYNSGTVLGNFSHSGVNSSVVFTLSANRGSVNRSASSTITFEARSFGGIGGPSATSATASGNMAVLNSSLGTLSDFGIHPSDVGRTYGPFSPQAQKIYLLLPHTPTAHTFRDAYGFSFPMNVPTTFTFVNQHSVNIQMDLYESTNSLSTITPYSITVEA
jgi:hypothetical protein